MTWRRVDGDGFCPVCWQEIERTPRDAIAGHFDTASAYCPGSREPFYIAIRFTTGSQACKTRFQTGFDRI